MKIIVAYNKHRHGGGADVVARATIDLLVARPDIEVIPFVRDSSELKGIRGKIRALVSGCYSLEAVKAFSNLLDVEKPDVVHAQEIYPLISPWIFKVCKKKGVPVVMTCHDYRMSCSIATHFRDGIPCYECPEYGELSCVKHNCCGSMAKSMAYAVRNYIGRKKRLFLDYVDLFLTPSEAAKEILCRYSELPLDRVVVVGNPVAQIAGETSEFVFGDYVAFAGRFESEKGFDLLLKATKALGVPVTVAGDSLAYLSSGRTIPDQVVFSGHLSHEEIGEFYRRARVVIVPSLCHETFGLVVAESLSCGTPVVVSDLGALSEVAGPGGLVAPSGDKDALCSAISKLWNDEELCRTMAVAGREHVKKYTDKVYLDHLLSAYKRVTKRDNGWTFGS